MLPPSVSVAQGAFTIDFAFTLSTYDITTVIIGRSAGSWAPEYGVSGIILSLHLDTLCSLYVAEVLAESVGVVALKDIGLDPNIAASCCDTRQLCGYLTVLGQPAIRRDFEGGLQRHDWEECGCQLIFYYRSSAKDIIPEDGGKTCTFPSLGRTLVDLITSAQGTQCVRMRRVALTGPTVFFSARLT